MLILSRGLAARSRVIAAAMIGCLGGCADILGVERFDAGSSDGGAASSGSGGGPDTSSQDPTTGGGGSDAGMTGMDCATCRATSCSAEESACAAAPNCIGCLGSPAACCAEHDAGAIGAVLQTAYACARAHCATECGFAAPACDDCFKNGDESDVDCGGTCGKCPAGKACGGGKDCSSAMCTGGVCQ